MHIRGVFANRFAEQGIDQPDDRRIALLFQQVGGLRHLIGQAEQVQLLVQSLGNLLGGALALAINASQARSELRRLQHLDGQLPTTPAPNLGQRGQRRVAAHHQAQGRALAFQQHAQASGETKGQRGLWITHRAPGFC